MSREKDPDHNRPDTKEDAWSVSHGTMLHQTPEEAVPTAADTRTAPVEDLSLEQVSAQFGLSVRAFNVCKSAGLERLSQIFDFAVKNGGFQELRSCGIKTQKELEGILISAEAKGYMDVAREPQHGSSTGFDTRTAPVEDLSLEQVSVLFGLSVRAFNVCEGAGFERLSQIHAFAVEHGGFRKLRNCGAKTQIELDDLLVRAGAKGCLGQAYSLPISVTMGDRMEQVFRAHFVKLSVHAQNVLATHAKGKNAQAAIRFFMQQGRKMPKLPKAGFKVMHELWAMRQSMLDAMAECAKQETPDDGMGLVPWAMRHGIGTSTLGALLNEERHITLLRFLSSLLQNASATAKDQVPRMFLWGDGVTATLEEIGEQHGITRERVRQLLSKLYREYPRKLAFVADLPGVRERYPELVTPSPVFVSDRKLAHHLNEKEGTEWSPLFMLFLAMAINGPRYMHCTWTDLFGRSAGFRGLDHAFPFMVEMDLVEPLRRVGAALASRYEEKRREPEPMEIVAGIHVESGEQHARLLNALHVLLPKRFPDATIRDGVVILPANRKSNQEDLLEEVLVTLDGPSHVTTILEKWHERFPGRPITEAGIRSVAVRNRERFFSVGRTSTYGLRRWEAERPLLKGGTIRDIVADLLERSSVPLHFEEIVEEVRKYRPATYISSVRLNLQLDESGRFVLLPNGFIGLADRPYDTIPEPPASVPGVLMRKVVVARFIGQHRRKLSEFIAARCKATSERIERVIDEAIREGRLHVDGMGHIRETPGESAPPDPWPDELPLDW